MHHKSSGSWKKSSMWYVCKSLSIIIIWLVTWSTITTQWSEGIESPVCVTHWVYQCLTCSVTLQGHRLNTVGLSSSPTYHFYHPLIVIMFIHLQVDEKQGDNTWDAHCEVCMHLAVKRFCCTAALDEVVTISLKCRFLYLYWLNHLGTISLLTNSPLSIIG